MNILKEKVLETSKIISKYGFNESCGMTRLLYSKEWIGAQNRLLRMFEESGLESYSDDIGNIYGRILGSKYPDQIIMSGSHIDTVVNGGNLDGQFGIEAAYLAMQYLYEQHGQPLRTLEVVSLAEEEGSRFPYVYWGSKNVVGLAKKQDVEFLVDNDGVNFVEAMHSCGFDFNQSKGKQKDIRAFVELHIEQGKVLETENKQLGIVTSIVGQRRYSVTLTGESNHAGTTPMGYRKDTVYAFSKFCSQSIDKANVEGDPLVLTFGKVIPSPNTVNVVPGELTFSIDCRHTCKEALTIFTDQIIADLRLICDELEIECSVDLWMDEDPIPMDLGLVELIEKQLKHNNANYKIMHSGAGHDAQIFAPVVPTAMLFVPSISGISHNPKEHTHLADRVVGVKALADILYELAYKELGD
ncbi:allantoate deiminase [Vibrio alfacsensis]|uniref:allantoate deiminase n=1 Tax=Vibrio alfacsensis TaxID=1074311 RepID=UPI001C7E5F95|nr:allantoate deiminase [Vibrio alfacsensis]